MIKIKLNKIEYQYLLETKFISDDYQIISNPKDNDFLILECSNDQADEIRDKCSEKLQLVGFDEKYELTPEGRILENLIDKFFIKQ